MAERDGLPEPTEHDRLNYVPPQRRKRLIRVRWYGPITIAAGVLATVAFIAFGPSTGARLNVVTRDGRELVVCAMRMQVSERSPVREEGAIMVSGVVLDRRSIWLDADPPTLDQIKLFSPTAGARHTYVDDEGALTTRPGRPESEPWSGALLEGHTRVPGFIERIEVVGSC